MSMSLCGYVPDAGRMPYRADWEALPVGVEASKTQPTSCARAACSCIPSTCKIPRAAHAISLIPVPFWGNRSTSRDVRDGGIDIEIADHICRDARMFSRVFILAFASSSPILFDFRIST